MIKVSIIQKSNQQVSHGASFDTMEEAQAWIASCEANSSWGHTGNEEYTNEFGEVMPAREKEYEIVIEDITSQAEQERINQEALAYLANTDWYVLRAQEDPTKPVPAEIVLARQQARERIIRS